MSKKDRATINEYVEMLCFWCHRQTVKRGCDRVNEGLNYYWWWLPLKRVFIMSEELFFINMTIVIDAVFKNLPTAPRTQVLNQFATKARDRFGARFIKFDKDFVDKYGKRLSEYSKHLERGGDETGLATLFLKNLYGPGRELDNPQRIFKTSVEFAARRKALQSVLETTVLEPSK